MMRAFLVPVILCLAVTGSSAESLRQAIEIGTDDITDQVVEWRRDIHANPELGNREFRTARVVADHLRSLGMEVRTEVAHTGVIGILRGGNPGPVVGLRADMDALPVTEQVDLPFASKVTTEYNGQQVGVMHACGHDNHVAILMGAASVLASMQDDLPGTVMFLFQPAEEGAPAGEEGGAELMLAEGAFAELKPDAVFGLHVFPSPTGSIGYGTGAVMAASDALKIKVRGKQTHAAYPWMGVDPVVTASQIVVGLQTIVSRQANLLEGPAVVSIAMFHGGVRGNIIPDEVELEGTIRNLNPATRKLTHERVRRIAQSIGESAGAEIEVMIDPGYPVTVNDADLTAAMLPTLNWAAADGKAFIKPPVLAAEDFSFFAQEAPGLYIALGVTPPEDYPDNAVPNHSPYFFADEDALPVGVKVMAALAVDYLEMHSAAD
jgi:amidohydrolase